MSENKPNGMPAEEEAKELFELLERLGRRDEVSRHQRGVQAFTEPAPDLVEDDPDAPDEGAHLMIDRFQPLAMSEEDLHALLITGDDFDEESEDEDSPREPKQRRNPFVALWEGFLGNIPRKGDSTGTKLRKGGFLFSLLVMLVAIVYLVVDLLIIPAQNDILKDELIELYHPDQSQTVVSGGDYPANMLASFKDLYDRNSEVRGWISYHSTGKKDFLDIEYPIVYRDVEDTTNPYLKMDFDGNKNRNGTLYFDQSNRLETARDRNRALIVYGHNMASGQMFAGLNQFLGSVNNARSATTFTMSTLFREDTYKVFAVVLIDESDNVKERRYNAWATSFTSDVAFLDHIEAARARSLFDYPVDVAMDDQIVVLSTCTGKTSAHVKDGRLVVMARRVRDGESVNVDTKTIVKNTDVIMPYYWYINQNKAVHKYYVDAGVDYPATPNLPTSTTTTTTTRPNGTTAATDGDATTGTTGSGTTGTTRPTAGTTGSTSVSGTTSNSTTTGTTMGDGTTASTDPTTESTDPTTESTEPTGESTDSTTESTDSTTESTEPTTESTEPTTETTESTTEPTTEPTETTEPTSAPTEATE